MILIIKKRLKMRRNQLYIPLFIATLAIVGSSCNDFLDELPDNRTELNSEQKIAKMLVSAYPEGSANELFELIVIIPTITVPDILIISYLRKSAITGKIPRKNIRIHLQIFGKPII